MLCWFQFPMQMCLAHVMSCPVIATKADNFFDTQSYPKIVIEEAPNYLIGL